MKTGKALMFVLLGILVAVAIFCITVAIASEVNGLSFFEQITAWFGSGSGLDNSVTDPIPDTGTEALMAVKSLCLGRTTTF